MSQIIPIRDLKNTSEISARCNQSNEPIFITKNGYGDMVIMSMKTYEQDCYASYVRRMLAESEKAVENGDKGRNFRDVFKELMAKYE